MANDDVLSLLPLPAISTLRLESSARSEALRAQMERSATMEIREEGKDLKEAAEQSLNVILDLSLDGKIRWASPTWEEVMGVPFDAVKDKPMSEIVYTNAAAFDGAVELMRQMDARSKIIQFSVTSSQRSVVRSPVGMVKPPISEAAEPSEDDELIVINLEAQGIMIYDHSTGQESHVRTMTRLFTQLLTRPDHVDDPACNSARGYYRSA